MVELALSDEIWQVLGGALVVLGTGLVTFLLTRRTGDRQTGSSLLPELRQATAAIALQRERQDLIHVLLIQALRISQAELAAVILRNETDETGEAYALFDGQLRVDAISLPSRIITQKKDDAPPDEGHSARAKYAPPANLPPLYPPLTSVVGTTIQGPDRVIGEMFLANKLHGFTRDDEDIVAILASQVSHSFENYFLAERLKRGYMETIEALVTAVEAKDAYTRGHSERVTKYAVAIAREMGLPPGQIEEIRIGAVLHDIGKIGVSEAIINKPGPLTEEEWRLMREHPRVATRIIDAFNRSRDILLMMYHHHESYDGRGYPSGLKGTEIPLSARIIRVADAFEAMTSERPYQRTKTLDEALQELRDLTGKQFDPLVVAAFQRVLLKGEG